MKHLIMINGTMGVGKTTTSKQLAQILQPSVFLDGDWCWDMHPFVVNEETKEMVLDNIAHLLNNFLACTAFDYVIFCWVMHEQSIIDDICSRLYLAGIETSFYSIVCEEETLRKRLEKDVKLGLRKEDVIERTIPRLKLYDALHTVKIDVTNQTSAEAAISIKQDILQEER